MGACVSSSHRILRPENRPELVERVRRCLSENGIHYSDDDRESRILSHLVRVRVCKGFDEDDFEIKIDKSPLNLPVTIPSSYNLSTVEKIRGVEFLDGVTREHLEFISEHGDGEGYLRIYSSEMVFPPLIYRWTAVMDWWLGQEPDAANLNCGKLFGSPPCELGPGEVLTLVY